MYQRLLMYKKKHGTICVPYNYKAGPKLGKWVIEQCYDCEDKNRIDLLNDIGFEFFTRKNHRCEWSITREINSVEVKVVL